MSAPALGRLRAAGVHLLLSLALVSAVAALMLLAWYPGPLFVAADGAKLFAALAALQIALGPLLTLLVFRPGKPGLKHDLAVIAFVQLAALGGSFYVIAVSRPAFIVFIKDRFDLVTAANLSPSALAEARYPQFRSVPWTGPVFVAADMPSEPEAYQKMLDAALAGRDLHYFPATYVPYEERRQPVLAQALTVAQLRAAEPKTAGAVQDYLTSSGVGENRVRVLMLLTPQAWVAVLVDPGTAGPLKLVLGERFE